jgi:hypothetical protein
VESPLTLDGRSHKCSIQHTDEGANNGAKQNTKNSCHFIALHLPFSLKTLVIISVVFHRPRAACHRHVFHQKCLRNWFWTKRHCHKSADRSRHHPRKAAHTAPRVEPRNLTGFYLVNVVLCSKEINRSSSASIHWPHIPSALT